MVMPGDEQPDPLPDVNARTTWSGSAAAASSLQRWSIPFEGSAQDGCCHRVERGAPDFLQHYFDDRTVAGL